MEKRSGSETRRIKLKKAYNFRDIGGYKTQDGRIVKWGTLFRSDSLAALTKKDVKKIEKLNLKLVIDLRSSEEAQAKPLRLPVHQNITVKNIATYGISKEPKELKKELFLGKLGDFNVKEEIHKVYQRAVFEFQAQGRALFDLLLDPANYPVLVLCNAGKDRTGVVIALIMAALGVSKENIIDDYMLSEKCLKKISAWLVFKVWVFSFFRADLVNLKYLLETRMEDINEFFAQIDRHFDSLPACLESLGLDPIKREQLMDILCD